MLSKNDLEQIGKVVDQRLEKRLDQRLTPLEMRFDHLETRFDQLEVRFDHLEKTTKSLKSDTRYLRKSINLLIEYVEEEDTKLKTRVGRIEDHIGLNSS